MVAHVLRRIMYIFLVNTNSNSRNKMTLIKKDEMIFNSKNVAEQFNTFFIKIVSNLDITFL